MKGTQDVGRNPHNVPFTGGELRALIDFLVLADLECWWFAPF